MLRKLNCSQDKNILRQLQLFSIDKITEGTTDDYTFHNKSKARYINPKVLVME